MSANKGCRPLINRNSTTGRFVINITAFLPAIVMAIIAIPLVTYTKQQSDKANYYEAVVENLAKPIVVVSAEGEILLANRAAHQLFGCPDTEDCLEGKMVHDFIAVPDEIRQLADNISLDTMPDHDIELSLQREDGLVFLADIGVRQLAGLNGNPVWAAVMLPHDDLPGFEAEVAMVPEPIPDPPPPPRPGPMPGVPDGVAPPAPSVKYQAPVKQYRVPASQSFYKGPSNVKR